MLYKHYKRASVFCAEALVLYYILCFLLRHTLLYGNRNRDRCADHRVVAHGFREVLSILDRHNL